VSEIMISDENFEEEVLKSDKPVLVDFWAEWCVPCKMLGPIIEEIAEANSAIKVCKANVDNASQVAGKYGIQSIPTLMLFNKGEVVKQNVGVVPRETIEEMFKDLI